jgi:hypothetical protein
MRIGHCCAEEGLREEGGRGDRGGTEEFWIAGGRESGTDTG